MQSSSRRAFLTARRLPASPWEAFCQRLERLVAGRLEVLPADQGQGRARLVAEKAADVHHARALCESFGVVLGLEAITAGLGTFQKPLLWVEPGNGLASFERLEPDSASWFVQPGVLVGELEAVGFSQFAGVSTYLTVAEWLADRQFWAYPAGTVVDSGLLFASVLLADGTQAGFGPFGESNTRPLEGVRLQGLVSSLFQLAAQHDAAQCLAATHWPARFRLDALRPLAGRGVNLATLLAGHGGCLGWLQWLVMQPGESPPFAPIAPGVQPGDLLPETLALGPCAERLDASVKAVFDPSGLFPG